TAVLSAGQGKIQNVSGKVGESLTLQTRVSGLQVDSQILWSDDSDKSVLVNYNEGKLKLDYMERFRGRLQLDPGSGSLTIKNLNIDDSGLYLGQIINGAGSTHRFNLTVLEPRSRTHSQQRSTFTMMFSMGITCLVAAALVECILITAVLSEGQSETQNVSGKVGGNITLQTGVSGLQGRYEILWSDDFNNRVLVDDYTGNLKQDIKKFGDRLQLDRGSGSLTIKNLNINDTGVYHAQIIDGSSEMHRRRFNLTVSDADPEPPTSAAPLITAATPRTHLAVGLAAGFAVVVIVLLLYWAVKHGKIGGNCLACASSEVV
ncbi:uncharacterized protein, partial [Centroberyx affinis]|uniref:uncharacterized protein n=1 Tax=Centroberyx affinis TaxID=166261 RepID=UPI003A5BC5AA